jgi:glycogen debranching enzyme
MLAGAYFQRAEENLAEHQMRPALDGDGWRSGPRWIRRVRTTPLTKGWCSNSGKIRRIPCSTADGRLAKPPIALCEVQGYAYAAKRAGALLARALNEPELAGELDAAAETLQSNFEEAFWCEELGTYALARDGEKKPRTMANCRRADLNSLAVMSCRWV